eukprot:CAMPEP_0114263958 /NCGR_PEP_ID=MMETSP0058-20121206/22876_1 /TAXON_ID=36894 /ORGANISM="Pyramimonas parkeae, CCMP726" /LENGTH=82 /DNA_ID=CAMNT_0001380451 /DNA_START=424 /DNA_END=668 /DNA_ORIENTATION=+
MALENLEFLGSSELEPHAAGWCKCTSKMSLGDRRCVRSSWNLSRFAYAYVACSETNTPLEASMCSSTPSLLYKFPSPHATTG